MRGGLAATLMLLVATAATAGGSFSVDVELVPIREQIPNLWRSLAAAFEFADTGGANMIGNNVNARLGHRRIGPYCLAGKPRGQDGPNTLLFCFNTEYLWLDANGDRSTLESADDVKERFVALEITPLKPGAQ